MFSQEKPREKRKKGRGRKAAAAAVAAGEAATGASPYPRSQHHTPAKPQPCCSQERRGKKEREEKGKKGKERKHYTKNVNVFKILLNVFQASGEEETLDSGPIFDTFGKDTKGRVRCIGSTISRKAILASKFAREMLKVVNKERDDWIDRVQNLREEMEDVKSVLTEFISDFKSGKFASVNHNVHTTSPTNATPTTPTIVTHAPSTTIPTLNDLIPCEIHSHTGEIVGYGRKSQLGAFTSVHGHRLKQREVRVVLDNIKLDNIKMLDYSVWGGKQGPCTTLEDVGKGGFMFWHDDFLPPLDDPQEQ